MFGFVINSAKIFNQKKDFYKEVRGIRYKQGLNANKCCEFSLSNPNNGSSKNNKENSSKFSKLVVAGATFLSFMNPALSISEIKPETNVLDESGTLTKSSLSYLEKTFQKLNQSNSVNVYLVSIRTLPYGEEANEYAKELFEKWDLKEKDIVVVLVNKIAKGGIYAGSEVANLNPSLIKSIGEETYTFKARDEQYSSAALDVSNRLVSIVSNKGDPGAPNLTRESNASNFKSAKNTEQKRSKYVAIIVVLLIIAFVVPMVQFFYYVKDE